MQSKLDIDDDSYDCIYESYEKINDGKNLYIKVIYIPIHMSDGICENKYKVYDYITM